MPSAANCSPTSPAPPPASPLCHTRLACLVCISIIVFLLLISSNCQASSAPPKLRFEKQIPGTKEQDTAKVYRHKVRQGEYIYAILQPFGLQNVELSRCLQEIKKLNPDIQDLDKILPGQTIALPAWIRSKQMDQPTAFPDSVDHVQLKTRTYQVRPGDSLVQILSKELGLPDQLIFDQYLDLVGELNPQIQDLNRLYPGQTINLPLPQKIWEQKKSRQVLDQNEAQRPAQIAKPQGMDARNYQFKGDHSGPDTAKQRLLSLLRVLGFQFAPGQTMFLPLPDGGWLRLNLEQSALAKTPWGSKVLFIPGQDRSELETGKLLKLDLEVCPTGNWSLGQTLQELQRLSQRRLLLWARDKSLILTETNRVLELKADHIVLILLGDKKEFHLFQIDSQNAEQPPNLLLGYLQDQNIYYHTLQSGPKPGSRFITPKHPQAKDLYLPKLNNSSYWQEITSAIQNSTQVSRLSDQELSLLKTAGQETVLGMSWGRPPGAQISLTLNLLQITVQAKKIYVLHPQQQNPFLLALLRHDGYDCFVF